jgi:hypothetical protein
MVMYVLPFMVESDSPVFTEEFTYVLNEPRVEPLLKLVEVLGGEVDELDQ